MTYPELGEAFGIAPASAKRLAIRRRWPKRPGNDGRARVGVPTEAIPVRAAGDGAGDVTGAVAGESTGDDAGDDTGVVTAVVTVLQRHIERLEQQLAETQKVAADRDAVATERNVLKVQLEALNAALASERQHVEEWKAVADRFAQQAERLAARRGWWPFRRSA
jgi:hypothetical protein